MKSTRSRLLGLALALSFGALAATTSRAAPLMPDFKGADRNADGAVSLTEFQAVGGHEQAFRAGDANHDSQLGADEYVMAVANHDRLKAGKYADDAWITAKVKALLLKESGFPGLEVNVETHQGAVQLSGWVSDPAQVGRAEKLASSIQGVRHVHNDLQVKR
jgi:hyperosmotically inducible protein